MKTKKYTLGFIFSVLLIAFSVFRLFTVAVAQSNGNYCEDRYGTEDLNACYRILWSQGILFVDPLGIIGTGVGGVDRCITKALPTINNVGGFASAINQYIDEYVGDNRTSPFQGQGQAFVDGGIKSGINPMLAVGHLVQENGLLANGTSEGWVGNVYLTEQGALDQDQSQRTISYNAFGREASSSQPHVYYKNNQGGIRTPYLWAGWADSLSGEDNWFDLIKRRYGDLPPDDLNAHIMRYAPPGDGSNDVEAYVRTLVNVMTKISSLAGDSLNCGGSGASGANLGNLNVTGPIIPCQGQQHTLTKKGYGVDWSELTPTGTIGNNSAGQPMAVYVRDACAGQSNIRTIVIGATIHAGGESGGQIVAHELLYNKQLPPDVRIVAIPVINGAGFTGESPAGRVNKNSVNLNRNFDYKWDVADPGEADANNPNFKGSSPASEVETKNIQNFLTSLGKSSLVISYHSPLNKILASGPKRSVSSAVAQKYAQIMPAFGNTSKPYASSEGGEGFFEGWYNSTTETPAILVEFSEEKSFEYYDKHADTLVTLLGDGTVPATAGNTTQTGSSGGSDGPVTYNVTVNTVPGVANAGDYKFPQIPHDGASLTECPTRQWSGANKLRTDIGVMFEGASANKYYNTITCTGGPIHVEGRAQDIYAYVSRGEVEKGNSVFEWLLSNADLLGIQYIKYWKVEWNPTQGIKCVSTVAQRYDHSNHVHYEQNWDGAKSNTPYFTSGQVRNSYITINQDICPALNPNNPGQEIK